MNNKERNLNEMEIYTYIESILENLEIVIDKNEELEKKIKKEAKQRVIIIIILAILTLIAVWGFVLAFIVYSKIMSIL